MYVNSHFIGTVMVSRSRSIPVSIGGSIQCTGIVVLPHNLCPVILRAERLLRLCPNYNYIIQAKCECRVSKLKRKSKENINFKFIISTIGWENDYPIRSTRHSA